MNYEKLTELENAWAALNENLVNEDFDFELFKTTCAETAKFFFDAARSMTIDHSLITLILSVHEFSLNKLYFDSTTEACKLVARALCDAITTGWLTVDGEEPRSDEIVVEYNDLYKINLNAFNLSELIADIENDNEFEFSEIDEDVWDIEDIDMPNE